MVEGGGAGAWTPLDLLLTHLMNFWEAPSGQGGFRESEQRRKEGMNDGRKEREKKGGRGRKRREKGQKGGREKRKRERLKEFRKKLIKEGRKEGRNEKEKEGQEGRKEGKSGRQKAEADYDRLQPVGSEPLGKTGH